MRSDANNTKFVHQELNKVYALAEREGRLFLAAVQS